MKFWSRFFLATALIVMTFALPAAAMQGQASSLRQDNVAGQKALNMLAKLTPEERVGQLFLVTMQGNTFDENSQIFDLIARYHVGGVVMQRSNDNFTAENTLGQAYALNDLLQQSELKASQQLATSPVNGVSSKPQYIPLLIGVAQEGGSYPNDQLLSGLTSLPDLMSIGATWNPELAQQVGQVMGKELSALGFNLYLGPSLDVLQTPPLDSGGNDLGVRTFGGSPYWVGKLGQAYIAGLHQGSSDRVMVVPDHFPGRGGSDRSPDTEIATVRKTFDELQATDLAPFFDVTGKASDVAMVADGLLVSHIRYQGIQGTIRQTTRPISMDSAAMDQLMKLQPISQWRENGGVFVSDNLGSQAVRRFYDPTGNSFDARSAAREAFFAGNDLLYMDRFIATGDPDSYTTITRTMQYFVQKYREDAVFAQRVDASVERILTLKFRLYPDFSITEVVPPQTSLAQIGQSEQVTFDVARRAVTLISPDAADLPNILPRGPEPRDRIVFITDARSGRQCSNCPDEFSMPVDALQSTILRLYGPRTGGQVSQNLMSSYSFSDLLKYLNDYAAGNINNPDIQTPPFNNDFKLSNWVVISMLNPNSAQPETMAFQRLLSEHPDLLRDKKVIVFAFDAPYYLDATDISKLTAYYAMYSDTGPFVEVAARILFQDLFAAGALPVSVPGIGYDLTHITAPDPTQIIPLFIDNPQLLGQPTATGTAEPTPAPVFRVGDVIPLRTGVIYDHNRNPVPDGTPVRFLFSVISESSGSTQTQIDTETVDGVARYMYRIERPGLLEIHVATDQDARSNLLRLDITTGISVGVTLVAPTPEPSETPMPTPTVTITPTVTPTAPLPPPLPPTVHFKDWFFALLVVMVGAAAVSWFGIRQAIARWGLRWALCGVIGGMLFYNYLALDMPGTTTILHDMSTMGVVLVTVIGVFVGWGVGLIWRQLSVPGPRSSGERMSERPATGPKSQSS